MFRLHGANAQLQNQQELRGRQPREQLHELLLPAHVVLLMPWTMVRQPTEPKRTRDVAEKSSVVSHVPGDLLHFGCLPSTRRSIKILIFHFYKRREKEIFESGIEWRGSMMISSIFRFFSRQNVRRNRQVRFSVGHGMLNNLWTIPYGQWNIVENLSTNKYLKASNFYFRFQSNFPLKLPIQI